MSGVTAGALAACESASSAVSAASGAGSVAAGATYIPGTYEATAAGINGDVKVTMTFTENAITDVVLDVSGETPSIGGAAAEDLMNALMEAQGADIQPVSGATITSNGVIKAAQKCIDRPRAWPPSKWSTCPPATRTTGWAPSPPSMRLPSPIPGTPIS